MGPYADYSYIVPLDGTGDSVLVQNYIYNDPLAIEKFKPGLDSTAAMLQYFSEVFGVYPFYKEKYGHSLVPLFGGMEHQTMTTCGNSGPLLVSHELAHQWFGDHVTCASWKDIWLNEGFASYAEYLFLKKFRGDTVAEKRMLDFHKNLMNPNDSGGTVYVDDTTNINRIFDGRLSYSKAAAVIHTLRFVINSDELFFDILKKYQQKFAFRNANTNDFKELAEQIVNTDLSVFFDQWIYKQGYPVYSSEWNSINGESFVRLKQVTTHPASVALFITPVELKLLFENSDTIVRVETTLNEQLYKFRFGKPITGVIVDPNNKLLNADRGVVKNIELGLNEATTSKIEVLPNPATDYWTILGIPSGCDMILTDMTGRVLQKINNGNNTGKVIYADGLSRGVYILHLLKGKFSIASFKLNKS